MNHIGDTHKYIPTRFWNSIEFAKKVFASGVSGSILEYFSDEIRNDIDICKMTLLSGGFRYMNDCIRQNKACILEIGDTFDIIDDIGKELLKDEDIIEAYWNNVAGYICGDPYDLHCVCSIIRNRQIWK